MQAGDLLELLGAVFWAVHVVVLGKFASKYDAIAFSSGQLLVGSALSWIAASLTESPGISPFPH